MWEFWEISNSNFCNLCFCWKRKKAAWTRTKSESIEKAKRWLVKQGKLSLVIILWWNVKVYWIALCLAVCWVKQRHGGWEGQPHLHGYSGGRSSATTCTCTCTHTTLAASKQAHKPMSWLRSFFLFLFYFFVIRPLHMNLKLVINFTVYVFIVM